jgi:4'-phosphopantetheinyl transferase
MNESSSYSNLTQMVEPRYPLEHYLLSIDNIHVWWASLNASKQVVDALSELLSHDEYERAARFVFPRDRERFVVARAMLRNTLSHYLDQHPRDISFRYGPHGKPYLSAKSNAVRLEFNLTYSRDLALCAVSYERRVGIDMEYLRPITDLTKFASVAFSRAEQIELASLADEQRVLGFFNGWTRKEAYVKARGDGLRMPLDLFDVSLTPGAPAALLASRFEPGDIDRWLFYPITSVEGYTGAVVVENCHEYTLYRGSNEQDD